MRRDKMEFGTFCRPPVTCLLLTGRSLDVSMSRLGHADA
jgi:hypothetical protein